MKAKLTRQYIFKLVIRGNHFGTFRFHSEWEGFQKFVSIVGPTHYFIATDNKQNKKFDFFNLIDVTPFAQEEENEITILAVSGALGTQIKAAVDKQEGKTDG